MRPSGARARLRATACAAAIIVWVSLASPAFAQETFQVLSVDTTGCNHGEFGMTVNRANLDVLDYTVRTLDFSYGPVPVQGTYPIPMNQQMRLDFTLERPVGTILYGWTLIVDGCNTATSCSTMWHPRFPRSRRGPF